MNILGLTGMPKIRKGVISDYLVEKRGYVQITLSSLLKREIRRVLHDESLEPNSGNDA
jgi:hypothetical protein